MNILKNLAVVIATLTSLFMLAAPVTMAAVADPGTGTKSNTNTTTTNPPTNNTKDTAAKKAIICGVNGAAGVDNCTEQPTTDLDVSIKRVVNILSVIIGVVAVIMIMVGGFRYITSGGNAESIKNARGTLTYAIVGLVIVALAQVIARFVLTNI